MAKHFKLLAIAMVALLAVSFGYLETQENWTGVKDNAFLAHAQTTNLDCNTEAPDAPGGPGAGGIVPDANLDAIAVQFASPTAVGGGYTGGVLVGGATRAALKLNLNGLFAANLPAAFTPLFDVRPMTANTGGAAGDIAALPQDPRIFDGFGGRTPSSFACYKHNAATTAWTALPYVSNPGLTAPTADGWALFQVNVGADGTLGTGDDGLTYVPAGTALSATTPYQLVLYIEDNGDYDTAGAAGTITDPPAFGFVAGGGGAAADDDDDDDFLGCVANPAAALSLEWLLLLIAPAVYAIRRRRS